MTFRIASISFYFDYRNNSSELIVEGDRDRINQAVSNLINNAIEFTSKKGGTISVTAEKRNVGRKDNQAEAVVNVVDSGEGIHHEIIPRLLQNLLLDQTQVLV